MKELEPMDNGFVPTEQGIYFVRLEGARPDRWECTHVTEDGDGAFSAFIWGAPGMTIEAKDMANYVWTEGVIPKTEEPVNIH